MPAGRPTVYKDEFCDKIIELGLAGKHVYQMCKELRVSHETLYRWGRENPEFHEAFTCARQFAKAAMLDRVDELMDNKNAQPKLVELKATFLTDYVMINGFQQEKDPAAQIEMLIKAVDRGERSPRTAEMMANAIEKRIKAREAGELEPLIEKLKEAIEAAKNK